MSFEPLTGFEGDTVDAFFQGLTIGVQPGNTTLLVCRCAVERVPVLAVLFFQRDIDTRGRQTIL